MALDGLSGEAEAKWTSRSPGPSPGLSWQEGKPESSLRLRLGTDPKAPSACCAPCCYGSEKPRACGRTGQRRLVSAGGQRPGGSTAQACSVCTRAAYCLLRAHTASPLTVP